MAAISSFPSRYSICRSRTHRISAPLSYPSPSCPSLAFLHLRRSSFTRSPYLTQKRLPQIRAVAEEETLTAETEDEASPEQPISVPVSASDMLTMFFNAEGRMDESAVSTVTQALEGQEGISDLNVQVLEGIASVELTKQTTVQATGVASNLVETIQGLGFKLQTLNLSFEDEEDISN